MGQQPQAFPRPCPLSHPRYPGSIPGVKFQLGVAPHLPLLSVPFLPSSFFPHPSSPLPFSPLLPLFNWGQGYNPGKIFKYHMLLSQFQRICDMKCHMQHQKNRVQCAKSYLKHCLNRSLHNDLLRVRRVTIFSELKKRTLSYTSRPNMASLYGLSKQCKIKCKQAYMYGCHDNQLQLIGQQQQAYRKYSRCNRQSPSRLSETVGLELD